MERPTSIKSVKRTTETVEYLGLPSAVRFADYILFAPPPPAVNCWAIVNRPLRGRERTLDRVLFGQSRLMNSKLHHYSMQKEIAHLPMKE